NLLPFYLLSAIGILWGVFKKEDKVLFISFSLIVAFSLYMFSTKLGIVDIRFIPFIQIYPLLAAAYVLGNAAGRLRGEWLLPLILVFATILWINQGVTFIPSWIDWNYEGFEGKAVWPAFNGVNQYLAGGPGDARVVYEHSQLHNSAGSSRAFESLPLFSGRATLEGLYMQSTVSSPFIFYIQSEISQVTSCPFPQWPCASFNPGNAVPRLEIFNVGEVIARTDATKAALSTHPSYELETEIGEYQIYSLPTNDGSYVVVPEFEPVLFETSRWKESAYLWFLDLNLLDVPVVFTEDASNSGVFSSVKSDGRMSDLPRIPIEGGCTISESVETDEIAFTTNCIGVPHIVKVSYFPNWKVEGADKIYLVSPSFMLVIPDQEQVRIYYGRTFIDTFSLLLTVLGLVLLVLLVFGKKMSPRFDEAFLTQKMVDLLVGLEKHKKWIILTALILIIGLSLMHYSNKSEARVLDDRFGMELALATKKYTTCDVRINDPLIKEECFKEVGIATGDYNLCDVRIENQALRDECFKEIGITTGDLNLCLVKITSPELKAECDAEIKKTRASGT
ncbi:MAG: 6-pyruvoyl-tetrahydropterin synthase-related protein, partial [Candidatus Hydrothermarchaeales archaeon]